MKSNESKCCDAVIQYLEGALASKRSNIRFPENEKTLPHDSRIDILLQIGQFQYALEHTLVEPFADHRRGGMLTRELETALRDNLNEQEFYCMDLLVPVGWHNAFDKKKMRSAFYASLATHVRYSTQDRTRFLEDEDAWKSLGSVAGVEIQATFRPADFDLGGLTVRQVVGDFQSDRLERIGLALEAKLPKLRKYKSSECKTVLILENNDLSLTNWQSVETTIKTLWVNYPADVDYLFYISACHSTWYLHPFVEEGKVNSRLPQGFANVHRFQEIQLADAL